MLIHHLTTYYASYHQQHYLGAGGALLLLHQYQQSEGRQPAGTQPTGSPTTSACRWYQPLPGGRLGPWFRARCGGRTPSYHAYHDA